MVLDIKFNCFTALLCLLHLLRSYVSYELKKLFTQRLCWFFSRFFFHKLNYLSANNPNQQVEA